MISRWNATISPSIPSVVQRPGQVNFALGNLVIPLTPPSTGAFHFSARACLQFLFASYERIWLWLVDGAKARPHAVVLNLGVDSRWQWNHGHICQQGCEQPLPKPGRGIG